MPKSNTYKDIVTSDLIKEVTDEISGIIQKRVKDFGNPADEMAMISAILSYLVEAVAAETKEEMLPCAVCNTIRVVKHARGTCPFGEMHIRIFKKKDGE